MSETLLAAVRRCLACAKACEDARDHAGAAYHQWLASGWLALAVAEAAE